MNVCKLIWYDLRCGILRNPRLLAAPIIAVFCCLYSQIQLDIIREYAALEQPIGIMDMFVAIFLGCDPLMRMPQEERSVQCPYFWIGFFVFALIAGFDYMREDLTQYGLQIITRVRHRRAWWVAKCCWSILSSAAFYALFLGTVVLFCLFSGCELSLTGSTALSNLLPSTIVYLTQELPAYTVGISLCIFCAPLLVLCTLNMLQMLLSLFCKPVYSLCVMVGVLLLGIISDHPLAFSRAAMPSHSALFVSGGFRSADGAAVCLSLIAAAAIIGTLYFKAYDILPDNKE